MSIESINQRLLGLTRQRDEIQRQTRLLSAARDQLQTESRRAAVLHEQMLKEGRDVQALEGISITNLFHTVLGDKEARLEQEQQEFLKAKLCHEEAQAAVTRLEREVERLESATVPAGEIEADYQLLLSQKGSLLQVSGADGGAVLRLSEELTRLQSRKREVNEAIAAGEEVLTSLTAVIKSLDSAAGWGVWDMLGGGMLATMAKHSNMDTAKQHAHSAQQAFRVFARELQDVQVQFELDIQVDGFLRFADYFFDGLIADWTVQSKINSALDVAKKQHDQVERVLHGLRGRLSVIQHDEQQLEQQREEALRNA